MTKVDLATIEQLLSKVVLHLEAKKPDHTVVVMPGLIESLNQSIQLQHAAIDLLKSINHNTHLPPSYSTSLEDVVQASASQSIVSQPIMSQPVIAQSPDIIAHVHDVIVSIPQQTVVNSMAQTQSFHSIAHKVPVMIRSNNIPTLPINDDIDGDSEIVEEVHDDNDEEVEIDDDD